MLDVGREDLCCAILVVLLLAIIAWKLLWLAAPTSGNTEGGRPTKHPACLAIGIPRLQRVAIYNRKLVHGAWNATWKRGHFPYATCPVSSGAAVSLTVAALLVADHQYAEVIPRWAAGSRAAHVDLCVVGQVGASQLPCRAARHVGCEC